MTKYQPKNGKIEKRQRKHIHHWTLNHDEKREGIELTQKEHGLIHGVTNSISNELSIRREIIYEVAKVVPIKELTEVLDLANKKIRRLRDG